ncbi:glutamine--fructose-6-phosphate transaminase (isomerizing) [Streptococcus mutans]|jgi:glutamine--fructose-6-phosphate transaminase|uniref:Glutamine--fructose-6-phosphate aminotransferase [isomerizing] n=1 Tax=Streptococcus mutans serotype c (strain ATCC 700610 / UA159) TaxID=210007 RepID=GLMS_STRMU|nr:glutamine--fructose-6-phosphate transaminase (isomerizing) [Streptococcus mutans]Q8DTY0.3 RecName: Full=Glutamine--fructose-6-phosphate aminotransferase [isomerizing]; AltName: Full=D-fructose-6-phosphate amidotransferase; AltName: Full=GFAT; AltName: Full=Glucosamine-6-phosphate synthase; AltName: Full=Hexosephosphate aminotransferase; AltName: Full=L-glutamine--D-fructose-6-phosphate amidotransferase [Streptococcus mutans UA159]AAN58876.1 glucosamine-fructose-6-phosphate aminotransferase [St
MCGIVGVVGNRNATDILMQGLEKLEYRGYDSAGIYVINQPENGRLIKSVGRIADLRAKIGIDVAGSTGIGHTRWATHGQATEENAHPHASATGRLVLVHNGVIENYLQIKENYLAGHNLKGETDTEIAVHLIGQFVTDGLSVLESFKKALHIIEGSYAFALIDSQNPDIIYVAKNKSPLLIGLGEGYNMVCSDAMAMIRETNQFMEIHDKELVVLTKDTAQVSDYDGNPVERQAYTAELDLSDIGKGTYPYYMLKEIDEQPTVMRKLISTYANENGKLTVDPAIVKSVQEADRIYILAAGTSYNAGFASKSMIETLTDTPVELGIASEWGYNMPLLSKKPMFILLSQSGETADSRQVLVKANAMGVPSLTITNVPGSTLSREATYTMLLHAGPEIAVASTKAYTAQIAALAFLSKAVGEANGKKEALEFDLVHELSIVAQSIEASLSEREVIEKKVANLLATSRNAFYIGRGNDYYVAMEASLKLKEISYIQCEGFAAGELKHGTISLIEEGTPVLALISSSETVAAHTRGNIQEVAARGANVLTVVEEGLNKEEDDVVVNQVHPYLSSISMVIPTQLIAYYASLQRGLDVDKPRNLAKAVTVE